jgi:predicted O-methyltransferase YrrM
MTNSRSVLDEIFASGRVEHPDGHVLDLVANISRENSDALRRFVRGRIPLLAVEVGMAYGVSTLSILDGMRENGKGKLISVDPYIGWATGQRVALHQVARAGLSAYHEHLHEPSYVGLPRLIERGSKADFVYIDGNHDYGYAFTDFFLADKLLARDGVVAFNDSGWRTVHKVIRHILKSGEYEEIDVGLPRAYRSKNAIFALIKRIEGRSTNDRYFRKK